MTAASIVAIKVRRLSRLVSGSVLANSEPVRESFAAELAAKAKRPLSVESPVLSAVEGAALMALKKVSPANVDEVAAHLAKRKS